MAQTRMKGRWEEQAKWKRLGAGRGGPVPRSLNPNPGPFGTLGDRRREPIPTHLSVQLAELRRPKTSPLPGSPGSEARWIRGGRWKRPSGSPGMPRRGLSGVWRDNIGLAL